MSDNQNKDRASKRMKYFHSSDSESVASSDDSVNQNANDPNIPNVPVIMKTSDEHNTEMAQYFANDARFQLKKIDECLRFHNPKVIENFDKKFSSLANDVKSTMFLMNDKSLSDGRSLSGSYEKAITRYSELLTEKDQRIANLQKQVDDMQKLHSRKHSLLILENIDLHKIIDEIFSHILLKIREHRECKDKSFQDVKQFIKHLSDKTDKALEDLENFVTLK